MKVIQTPQASCKAAVGRCDITPPVGIYHRMWGAALHDRATGVHRPLFATLLCLQSDSDPASKPVILVSLDHCILDRQEIQSIKQSIARSTDAGSDNILVTLTHTHGAGWMSRSRSDLPGGELLAPYLDQLADQIGALAEQVQSQLSPCTMIYAKGRCNLAAHRNYLDEQQNRFVCGLNPTGFADDTLMLSRITSIEGNTLATVVNYACHPTTLAWENTLISPDWIGAMREVIEKEEGGLCLFLQGASGDLGPREGFVGDTEVAERNGRQVGFASLSTLATLPKPMTQYCYTGSVVSGTRIGTWQHQPLDSDSLNTIRTWHWESLTVDLPYRHDLPTVEETLQEQEHWQKLLEQAQAANDLEKLRDSRAQVEQCTRQLTRLGHLIPGRCYPLEIHIGFVGDAIWIFLPGEIYQIFQTTLRERFAPKLIFVTTLTNDWQPGYIPEASSYGYDIYQEVIAATAPGCLEVLIESITRRIDDRLKGKR